MIETLIYVNLVNLVGTIIGGIFALVFSEIAFKVIDASMLTVDFETRINEGDMGAWALRICLYLGTIYLVAQSM